MGHIGAGEKEAWDDMLEARFIPRALKELYKKLFPSYTDRIKEELVGEHLNFILDLGCGKSSPIKSSSRNFYTVGIDLFGQYLLESKKRKTHNEYILGDVRKLCFQPKSFDAVLGIDLLEYISKSRGRKLIKAMEKIAKRKVVIFTTNGFIPQREYNGNVFQVHRSGWTVNEFKQLGYNVKEINGLWFLRGERAMPKFKQKLLNILFSDLTQKITLHYPEYAFALLCVKNFKKKPKLLKPRQKIATKQNHN